MKQPTMKDVAKAVGVSQPTVSHVINGTAPISDEVRRKVLQAIEELGYVPDAMAKGLKTRKSTIVGLIVPDVSIHYYSVLVKAIEKALRIKGFMVFLCNTFYDPELERQYMRTLIQHNVTGVIFCADLLEKKSYKILDNHSIPIVMLYATFPETERNITVGVDIYLIAKTTVDHLCDVGARTICYVSEPTGTRVISHRLECFKRVMKEKGIANGDKYCFVAAKQYDSFDKMRMGYNIGANILAHGDIDAVFASSDEFAFGVVNRLVEYGIRIPEDILIMGCDNDAVSTIITPSLTSIVQPIKQMAKVGVDLLCEAINNEDIKTRNVLLEPGIVIRESTVKVMKREA